MSSALLPLTLLAAFFQARALLFLSPAKKLNAANNVSNVTGASLIGHRIGETVIVDLGNVGNFQYTFKISVGGQIIKALMDTGSFSLITSSTHCDKDRCPHRGFDYSKAEDYELLNRSRKAIFSAGTIDMHGAQAPLLFGPGFGPETSVFWEIMDMDEKMTFLWEHIAFDAIAGMARPALVPKRGEPGKFTTEKNFIENFGVQAFQVCLGDEEQSKKDKDGYAVHTPMTPSRLYLGPPQGEAGAYDLGAKWLATLPVHGPAQWMVKISKVSVHNASDPDTPPWHAACWDSDCVALIDTGTAVMTAPFQKYYDLMNAMGPVFGDCRNYHQLHDVLFTLGEGDDALEVRLKPEHYVEYLEYNKVTTGEKVTSCEPMFMRDDLHSADQPTWILGAPLMRLFLWEFDRQKAQIRVAKHPGHCPGDASGLLPGEQNPAHNMGDASMEYEGQFGIFHTKPSGADSSLPLGRPAARVDARRLVGDGLAPAP